MPACPRDPGLPSVAAPGAGSDEVPLGHLSREAGRSNVDGVLDGRRRAVLIGGCPRLTPINVPINNDDIGQGNKSGKPGDHLTADCTLSGADLEKSIDKRQ